MPSDIPSLHLTPSPATPASCSPYYPKPYNFTLTGRTSLTILERELWSHYTASARKPDVPRRSWCCLDVTPREGVLTPPPLLRPFPRDQRCEPFVNNRSRTQHSTLEKSWNAWRGERHRKRRWDEAHRPRHVALMTRCSGSAVSELKKRSKIV